MRGSRRTVLLLGGLVLLVQVGLMLAAFHPSPHTGGDNAGYLALAHSLLDRGAYLDLYLPGDPIHTKYPPGFPVLLAGAALLGAETWTAFKAVVAGSTTLAVLFVFLWAREREGPVFGAMVAGLVAASSALVYYSHWVLSDVPFLALTFLALWAFARAEREGRDGRWLLVGCVAAVAAYFTRSAGLPLVIAAGGWLALRARWRALGAFALGFGAPALLWVLRGLSRPDTYVAEFWLVNPYEPDLGRAGIGDLATRVVGNAQGYVTAHLPGGITGLEGTPAALLGLGLLGFAAAGWTLRVRNGRSAIGVSELFFPLYAGLLLLWPEVWSGDRFALPLVPLLLLYGGKAVVEAGGRLGRYGGAAAAVVAVVVLAAPALDAWSESAAASSDCVAAARARGPWVCMGPAMTEFVAAAGWSASNLPEGSVVFARKPRFFHLVSGLDSETFPLSAGVERFFDEAARLDAGYVLVDRLDGLATYYVGGVVRERPRAFCPVVGFGEGEGAGAQLLGILPERRDAVGESGDGGLRLSECPGGMVREDPGPMPDYSSSTVPLFVRTSS